MRDCPYPMAELLPHGPPMILLDRVAGWDVGRLEASVHIRPESPFYDPEHGVPGHVGIEYMAQACGAYAGLEAITAGLPVRIGFLLGTRRYFSTAPWYRLDETLTVSVTEILRDGAMGVFDCQIAGQGGSLATARLSFYQPEKTASPSVGSNQSTRP